MNRLGGEEKNISDLVAAAIVTSSLAALQET